MKFKIGDKVVTKASVNRYPRRRGEIILEASVAMPYTVKFSDGKVHLYDKSDLSLYIPKKKVEKQPEKPKDTCVHDFRYMYTVHGFDYFYCTKCLEIVAK